MLESGYGQFWLNGKGQRAHRVAYLLEHGYIPKDKIIMHVCDVRNCVNPAHLRAGTWQDNMMDMHTKGRARDQRGENNCRAKLTALGVKRIRKAVKAGVKQTVIVKLFGVSKSTVCMIVGGATWK